METEFTKAIEYLPKISCALQMKISLDPFLTEATNNKANLLKTKVELNNEKTQLCYFIYNFMDLINKLNLKYQIKLLRV